MGKVKYYRSNIKQQIHSLACKSKYFYLKNINISRYGLCLAEAELLAEIANHYYQNYLLEIPENYFLIPLYKNLQLNKKQNLQTLPKKIVTIPAFSHYELEIYQLYGLKALQTYRILTILDHVAHQNARIDINLLAKIVNITPKAIRQHLIPFFEMGFIFPLLYLLYNYSNTFLFRYSKALKDFFINMRDKKEILSTLLISKVEWSYLLFNFFQFSYQHSLPPHFPKPLLEEISSFKDNIMRSSRYVEYSKLYPPIDIPDNDVTNILDSFCCILKNYFSFSNALIADYANFLKSEAMAANNTRKNGEIIYYAVSENTRSGTPLTETEFVAVKLTMWAEDDKNPESAYSTKARKWNKALRYSIQAQNQNAHLSQYDLAYLLGSSVGVIKQLLKIHKSTPIPTRGNIHDIGPGISHAENIIKLYLQGYTETEIKFKTGHCYESIENYLKNFTKVVGLTDLGLNLNQIRMSARISAHLALKFNEIYKKFNKPSYGWILAKIRNNFNCTFKKNYKQ
jgi:hypothetical protein